MKRGYSVIALDNPKCLANLGGAMRAAHVYGAGLVIIGGQRMLRIKSLATDTMKAYRHIPVLMVDDVTEHIPYDCVPVAIELLPQAKSLITYSHPERACYFFGPEDGTLGKRITERCRDILMIPMDGCMNLAATVNVVLYDRLAKSKL